MLTNFYKFINKLKSRVPLVYSIILIILVPGTLIFNTWWNLTAFENDMNTAIREQINGIQNTLIVITKTHTIDQINYQQLLTELQQNNNNLITATFLKTEHDGTYSIISTTDQPTGNDDLKYQKLNNFAWATNDIILTKIYHAKSQQNLWMAISPLYDQNQKIGLINLKISTSAVEKLITRTSKDALIILTISVVIIILLLINHLRYFQQSLFVEKLKELDQMKDDFISVASHELRTPLTAIKSYAAMLEKDFGGNLPDKIAKRMHIINSSINRLEKLINDLLNVSRIQQGKLDFTLTPINSNQLVSEIVNQLKPTAEQKNLNLKFEPIPDLPNIMAHQDRLREVLINLIGNAIKYTLEGSVEIYQKLDKNKLKIIIQDTGIGISPEEKQKLFQKFSRIRNDKTKNISGTGLGLWISKSIMEKMKGKIYVDSIIDKGTAFTLVLPTEKTT